MMLSKAWLIAFVLITGPVCPQQAFRFVVKADSIITYPYSFNLKETGLKRSDPFNLLRIEQNGRRTAVPYQADSVPLQITFLVAPSDGPVTYELVKERPAWFFNMQVTNEDSVIRVSWDNLLLQYVYKTVYPPAGVDSHYRRSSFIHPLNTINGLTLTQVQPADHYHHYGLWNAWTHTLFENDTIDFWNLKEGKGRVRFAALDYVKSGPVYTEYRVKQVHIAYRPDGSESTALEEWQTVRIYKPEPGSRYYYIDIRSRFRCGTTSPLLLLTYRYGGLGWRANETWDAGNTTILTSAGNAGSAGDGQPARWIFAESNSPKGGGMLLCSGLKNNNHPEPIRIWETSSNKGKNNVFINFTPTRDRDWLIEPGITYELNYRLLIYDGHLLPSEANAAWNQFAAASRP